MIREKRNHRFNRIIGRRGALTLVELMATTGALVVLTAMLVPAAASVGRSSKFSRCLSQMKQIGYANLVYASDDPMNMALPVHRLMNQQDFEDPTHIGAYEWGGKSGVGRPGWLGDPPDPLNSKYGTQAGFGPATRPLNGIIYGDVFPDYTDDPGEDGENWRSDTRLDLDVYECPSDSGYTGVHFPAWRDEKNTSFDHFGTSYTANLFMTGPSAGGEIQSNSPYLRPMSDVISPSTTLAYQENNGRFAWTAQDDPCDFLPGVPGVVGGWHGAPWMFNATFIDGHAEEIHMRKYYSVDIGRFEDDVTYSLFRCIILRGEGWQIDTLPASRVRTGLVHGGQGRPSYEDGIE